MADNTDIRIAAMAKKAGVSVQVMQQTVDDLVLEHLLNKPRRGRKSENKKHRAIIRSIEALRSIPMRAKAAINEAAAAWGYSAWTIEDIYSQRKRFFSLDRLMGTHPLTDGELRSTYRAMGLTKEQILESIRQHARK